MKRSTKLFLGLACIWMMGLSGCENDSVTDVLAEAGESCAIDDCADGLVCECSDSNVCGNNSELLCYVVEGRACDTNNRLCATGLECRDGFCRSKNGNGGGNNNGGNNNGGDDGECLTTFTYYNQWTNKGSGGEQDWDVYLVGSFNKDGDTWITTDAQYKMQSDGNGTHTITVNWPVGTQHEYKYYVNGWENDSWKTDASDGQSNGVANITSCGMKFGVGGGSSSGGGNIVIPEGSIRLTGTPSVDAGAKTVTFTVETDAGNCDGLTVTGGVSPVLSGCTVSDTVSEYSKYNYWVKSSDDELYVPVWVEENKFDWHDALLYFAFTDRFKDGDSSNNSSTQGASIEGTSNADWMGGDFKGMLEKVEDGYFDKLGVNTLWISSVSTNTNKVSYGTNGDTHGYSAYHSYWPISSFMTANNQAEFGSITAIEPHFGTMEELKALVDACHKRGIRVLVDFAANHVHTDSPMYQKHQDWFNMPMTLCDSDGNWDKIPETCWFSQDLPDINYNKPEVRQLMVEHAVWLIKETNIDGFRVDAVKHMPLQFIKDLRAAVESLFNKTGIMFYMVGETFTGDIGLLNKYIGNDTLHAQFDFPLYYQMQNVLKSGGMHGVYSENTLYSEHNPYNSDLMGTFMGNHDVARAISVAAGQEQGKWAQNQDVQDSGAYFRLKQAWTILLTNPGIPLIYYGDEYGMVGGNDPDNRRMMNFNLPEGEQSSTLGYVQLLGTIRSQHKALTRGKRVDLHKENDKWCYKLSHDNETIIVGVASLNGNGTCDLQGSYNMTNLLNGSEVTGMSQIDFNGDKFHVYLVK